MAKAKKDRDIEFDFFNININELDKEWINQPKIFFKYASELADARRRLEQARAELDMVKAAMDRTVRENPKSFGLPEKLTEALIINTIIQQPEYQDALKSCRKRKHRVDILQAAVSALDHRKSALERLVSLHGQNYFATPKPIDERSIETADNIEKGAARRKKTKRR